jgi:hypothetical protein
MGAFVDLPVNRFTNLSNTPQVIVSTSPSTNTNALNIDSITICNRGAQPILIFLKRIRVDNGSTMENFIVNYFEIDGYNQSNYSSVNIVGELELQIRLNYQPIPSPLYESLVCYSNGYTQVFDCEVNYTKFNDLP